MSVIPKIQEVKLNYHEVLRKVDESAKRSGRDFSDITVVGVTKRIEIERIKPAIDEGLTNLGEVIGTELKTKILEIRNYSPSTIIHVIGNMQSNKTKFAVEKCDLVQSVRTEKILELLNKYAQKNNKLFPIFLEIDFSGKEDLKGINKKQTLDFLKKAKNYHSIEVQGLMTIAPLEYENKPDSLRRFFSKTYEFYKTNFIPLIDKDETFLSMGMSSDFEIAIEEGSNLIRVGTAIFGPRNPK